MFQTYTYTDKNPNIWESDENVCCRINNIKKRRTGKILFSVGLNAWRDSKYELNGACTQVCSTARIKTIYHTNIIVIHSFICERASSRWMHALSSLTYDYYQNVKKAMPTPLPNVCEMCTNVTNYSGVTVRVVIVSAPAKGEWGGMWKSMKLLCDYLKHT